MSDFSTILAICEQQLKLHLAEVKLKLDDLIYKEQANQLWKAEFGNTVHTIWGNVCSQRVCTSTSCQTGEQLEEEYGTLVVTSIHSNETSRTTQEEENNFISSIEEHNEFNYEERHCIVEVIPCSSSSVHEDDMSAAAAADVSPEQPIRHTNETRSDPGILHQYSRNESKLSYTDEMSQHKRIPIERVKTSSKCDLCSRVFTSGPDFTFHHRFCSVLPNENGYFDCPECEKSYPTREKLRSHIWYHKEKRLKCAVCDKAYLRMSELTIHMRTHTGARPFLCELCQKRFSTKGVLKKHIRLCRTKTQENA